MLPGHGLELRGCVLRFVVLNQASPEVLSALKQPLLALDSFDQVVAMSSTRYSHGAFNSGHVEAAQAEPQNGMACAA